MRTFTDTGTGVTYAGGLQWVPCDDDGRYKVNGWPAVAVYVIGIPADTREEWVSWDDEDSDDGYYDVVVDTRDDERVVVMVGDDATHSVAFDDLEPIADDDYCSGCGQIGCGWC